MSLEEDKVNEESSNMNLKKTLQTSNPDDSDDDWEKTWLPKLTKAKSTSNVNPNKRFSVLVQ